MHRIFTQTGINYFYYKPCPRNPMPEQNFTSQNDHHGKNTKSGDAIALDSSPDRHLSGLFPWSFSTLYDDSAIKL